MKGSHAALDRASWDDYRYVLAVARHGTLAESARALDVSDATVSRHVERVERMLGVALFDRERGRMTARADARRFIESLMACADLLTQARDTLPAVAHEVSGTVRVTTAASVVSRVLAPRLGELHDAHDGLEIELLVDTAPLGITYRRETDIAVRALRPTTEQGALARRIGTMRWAVYAHRDLVARGGRIGWIAYARRSAALPQARWIEEARALDDAGVWVRVDNPETHLSCVLHGLGKSVLPEPFGERSEELVRLGPASDSVERELWMLVHPSAREVRRLRVVADWVEAVLGEWIEGPPQ